MKTKSWEPDRCTTKGCRGIMIPDNRYKGRFTCSICGTAIWGDIKVPPVKEIMEAGCSIQTQFGLNTREIRARIRNKGSKSSGRRRRAKKSFFVKKPLDL